MLSLCLLLPLAARALQHKYGRETYGARVTRGAADLPPPSEVVREALERARITAHALERRPGEKSHNRPESPLTVAVAALDVSDSSSS